MKKGILLLICALAGFGAASGQGIERMRVELARADGARSARVEVTEQPDAARAVEVADHTPHKTRLVLYRVNVFSDNSQSAGANAAAAEAQFREAYPEISAAVSYDSPYFRVVAGGFFDRTSAIALCGKVAAHFPKAYVIQREMAIADLLASGILRPNTLSLPKSDENNEGSGTN